MIVIYILLFIYAFILILGTIMISDEKECDWRPVFREGLKWPIILGEMLIEKWNNKGRLKYAVTPRFAPTSSESELAVAGRLLKEFPDVYMHTHLAENNQEVAWVHELFPWARSYLDVYDHYGLVTSHSVFAHSIHIDAADYSLLSK